MSNKDLSFLMRKQESCALLMPGWMCSMRSSLTLWQKFNQKEERSLILDFFFLMRLGVVTSLLQLEQLDAKILLTFLIKYP